MLKTSLELFLSNPSSKHSSSNGHNGNRNSSVNTSNPNLSNMASDRIGTSMATNSKAGELVVILDGLNVDMANIPAATPSPSTLGGGATAAPLLNTLSLDASPSLSPRSSTNTSSLPDDTPEAISMNNNVMPHQNGITGVPNSGNVSGKNNGGRSKRNSSGSSQPSDQSNVTTSATGRLPPLNPAASDRRSGNRLFF